MKYIDIRTNNILVNHEKLYFNNQNRFMCIKPDIAMTVIYLFNAMGPDNSS